MNKIIEKPYPSSWPVHLVTLLILAVVPVIIYSNTFQAPFVFDDIPNIVEKTTMQMTSITYKSLHRAAFEGANVQRWLPNLSFALNYYFGRHEVWGYHLLNLMIHVISGMVLYGLCFTTLTLPKLGVEPRQAAEISLISAVVWAVHPLQTNAVTFIVQRMTSMAALFYLASLWLYVLGRLQDSLKIRRYVFLTASLVFGLLALASKQNSAMLPLIILAYEVYFLREQGKRVLSRKGFAISGITLIIFFVIGCFYVGRSSLLSVLNGYEYRDFTLVERLLTESRIIFHYLSLIVLPLPSRLNLDYDYLISHSLLSPSITLASMFGIICLIALTIYLFRRHRLLSFGLLWFLSNLAIESTVIPLELIFEHRLYLPSSMFILAIVFVIYGLWKSWQKMFRGACVAIIIVLCFFTWQRNEVWGSEEALWRDVVAKSPNKHRVYIYLGRAYNMKERYQEAYDLFQNAANKQAYNEKFNDVDIYNNWGKAAFNLGMTERAVKLLEHAVRLDQAHPESHYNLGVAYGSQGRLSEARREMAIGMGLQQTRARMRQ